MQLYINASNIIYLNGLYDNISETYVNNASVTYTITDNSSTPVATGSLAYISTTNGNYSVQLASNLSLINNTQYTVTVVAVYGGNTLTISDSVSCNYFSA
jgi:hypothetical protein